MPDQTRGKFSKSMAHYRLPRPARQEFGKHACWNVQPKGSIFYDYTAFATSGPIYDCGIIMMMMMMIEKNRGPGTRTRDR